MLSVHQGRTSDCKATGEVSLNTSNNLADLFLLGSTVADQDLHTRYLPRDKHVQPEESDQPEAQLIQV